jgi:hypothetical protein
MSLAMISSWKNNWQGLNPYLRVFLLWLAIALMVLLGIKIGVDKTIIYLVVAVFGVFTQAFTSLLAIIALVPILGPLIVKVLTLPFFWIVNGLGYYLSILAIKRGYTKEVVNYRVLTFAFLLGIVFGYVIGKIL